MATTHPTAADRRAAISPPFDGKDALELPGAPVLGAKAGRGRPRKTNTTAPVGIQSVDIALDIIAQLVKQQDGMNLSELSRACGLQPSKLHRYLVSFTRHGLLRQSSVTHQYDFGPFARRLGAAALNRHHGLGVVHEAMTDLGSETGCTVYLYIWTELGPTLVRAVMGRQTPLVILREGTALPAAGSATGRVFLAHLPAALTGDLLRKERELTPDEGSPTWSDHALASELDLIRANKVYWTSAAILPGPLAVAPVFDADAKLHSVLVLIPPRGTTNPAQQRQLIRALETQVDRLAGGTAMTDRPAPACGSDSLLALWQAALARPLHGAGCGCSAPMAVRIDAASLELDLLDHIEMRHRLDAVPGWQAALAQRRVALGNSFTGWIESLKGVHLDPALHERVVSDIRTTLLSMTEHAAGRLAPVSALGSGWLMKQATS